MTDTLIFVDIETTGLEMHKDVILEIGCLAVDGNLDPLDDGLSVVLWTHEEDLEIDPYVREMHTRNGLLAEVESGMWQEEAEDQLLKYVRQFGQDGEIPMAGSSIHFDRKFLERDMPKFEDWFHYRCVDVSTVKELWLRWFPGRGEPPKVKAHRALPDCVESLEELRWYKQRFTASARLLSELVKADG